MLVLNSIFQKGRRLRSARAERRLHNRALIYWEERSDGRDFAALSQFNIADLEGVHPHSFILDLTFRDDPVIASAGDLLCEEADLPGAPARLKDVRPSSLLGQFARRWELVVEERRPLTSEYVFTTDAGFRVYCRGVLLPLSATGCDIDHLCGVVGWKSVKLVDGVELPPGGDRP